MRILVCLVLVFAVHGTSLAESISVPWEEFRQLYTESLLRGYAARDAAPQRQTIETAEYQLTLGAGHAEGRVRLSGEVLSGGPEPIALLGGDLVIAEVREVHGGSLITSATGDRSLSFLPLGASGEFAVELSFLVLPGEDSRSKRVHFAIPRAIRNTLRLSLPPGASLIEAPGISDGDGVYHFSLEDSLEVRYLEAGELPAVSPIEIDMLSVIAPQGKRLVVAMHGAPAHPTSQPLLLRLPPGAEYLASSLLPSQVSRREGDRYEIRLPDGKTEVFFVQFAVAPSAGGQYALTMPTIEENRGREGDFVVEEPDDGQVSVSGTTVMSAPAGGTIQLDVKRFETVSAPAMVLDAQYFFTSFEENGSVLSVLAMDVPPTAGPRLPLQPVAEAEIWSLAVNGKERKVYADAGGKWIIPLDEGEASHVELSLLRKGEKLGLAGRLETTLPATGLAARMLCVGIALPERVQLLSLEGPVSPAPGAEWKLPADFIGKPYLFSRAFHKGEGMTLAVSYKEPVKP